MHRRALGQRGLGQPIADAPLDRATHNAGVPTQALWARANPSERDVRRSLAPLTIEEPAGEEPAGEAAEAGLNGDNQSRPTSSWCIWTTPAAQDHFMAPGQRLSRECERDSAGADRSKSHAPLLSFGKSMRTTPVRLARHARAPPRSMTARSVRRLRTALAVAQAVPLLRASS